MIEPSGATLSSCERYRYLLWRRWNHGGAVLWIMLNPSTADAHIDDPTIRRCIGFAKAWDFAAIEVVNLYAFRATDPRALWKAPDPEGPGNALEVARAIRRAAFVVAAWGTHAPRAPSMQKAQLAAHEAGKVLHCLGRTKAGAPKHPLYVKGSTLAEAYLHRRAT